MAYRTRIKYTPAQKQEIWDRWGKGESLNSIGPLLADVKQSAHVRFFVSENAFKMHRRNE